MAQQLQHLRNIGVIAHIDAGKTTVTERMLFYAHFSHRIGRVDDGTTVTDYDPEEQERGITINSACVTFPWRQARVNLIDTPGHVDFTAEVERSLRVLDGAVVVFSAREGVEAQSETVWHQADRYHVPRIAFINKMDREGADFFGTLEEIEKRLGCERPLPVNLPVGSGPPHVEGAFCGIVDLIEMKMLIFPPEKNGTEIVAGEIPESMVDEAEMWRAHLLDQLSLFSDDLAELLMEEKPVPNDMIRRVIRDATIHDMVVPVLCGSALDGIGIQPLLDAVGDWLPSPGDLPPVSGTDPENPEKKLHRKSDPAEPFCGLLFKIQADKFGDLHYVRVYSGTLKANSRVLNPGKDAKENVPHSGGSRPTAASRCPRWKPATSSGSSACGTASPATPCAIPGSRSCWNRSSSRKPSFPWRSSPRRPTSGRNSRPFSTYCAARTRPSRTRRAKKPARP